MNSIDSKERIKNHFETEAVEFDNLILKLIPFYEEMIEALISTIPFENNKDINVIDLGCGTGTISLKIKEKFPNAKITCLDIAENMLNIAKFKLSEFHDITFCLGDFNDYTFDKKYDVVVSSLALHHLVNNIDKKIFYEKVFKSLNDMGVFYNADVVLGSNSHNQNISMKKWTEYMNKNVSIEEIENKWIPNYEAEDRPAKLYDQLEWLSSIGFNNIDVVWKYHNFAVYGGQK